jgi:hypothetical protein
LFALSTKLCYCVKRTQTQARIMFETVIDIYCRWTGEFVYSTTVESASKLTESDCKRILLEDGHDLAIINIAFVSMRKRPALPSFLQNEFKIAEQQFRERLKSR